MPKSTILIVDDDQEYLKELKENLTLNDYDVLVFDNAASVLEIFVTIEPDLMLIDLKMNEMNGFKLARKLRYLNGDIDIPMLAITAFYTQKEHHFLTKMCGFKDILIKPMSPELLIEKIEKNLAKNKSSWLKSVS